MSATMPSRTAAIARVQLACLAITSPLAVGAVASNEPFRSWAVYGMEAAVATLFCGLILFALVSVCVIAGARPTGKAALWYVVARAGSVTSPTADLMLLACSLVQFLAAPSRWWFGMWGYPPGYDYSVIPRSVVERVDPSVFLGIAGLWVIWVSVRVVAVWRSAGWVAVGCCARCGYPRVSERAERCTECGSEFAS